MSVNEAQVLFTNKMVGLNIRVQKNDKGWYRVKLGELNAFNSKGEYYLDDGFMDVLTERNSYLSVANRLESGLLEGEVTHPIREGHTDNDWLSRNLIIDGARTSHKIMSIELVNTGKYELGREIKEIWGWILPSDLDVGRSLKADLDNPDVNVAFSIRCFSRVVSFQGRTARIITKMITYDKIDIPGLKNAIKGGDREAIINSKSNITKESGLTDFIVDSTMLKNLVHELSNNVTTESAGIISTLEEIGQSMSEKKDIFYSW
jgi:hypothetical protein